MKSYDQPRQHIKKQRHYFADKGMSSQNYGFSNNHVWVWELNHKEDWMMKNWCFWTVMLEKTLESPLDFKEIQPVNLEGNQSWIFTGRIDAEAEAPIVWPPDANSQLIRKDPEGRRRRGWQRWDSWMASQTQQTGVWARSGKWRRTGKPGVLQSMRLQRVRHNWATEEPPRLR